MEDYYNNSNYQNLLQQSADAEARDPANKARERANQLLEDKKREILMTSEGLTTPMIVEGLRGIGKSAFSKAKSKVEEEGGETAKGVMNKLDEMKGDFEDGGMKKVLSRQVENLKGKFKSKAEAEIRKRLGQGTDQEEFKLQNLKNQAEQKARDAYQKQRDGTPKVEDETTEGTELSDLSSEAVETNIGKQTVGNLDQDIQDGLSKNPSVDEVNDAILRQSNRDTINDLRSGKKLPTKELGDDMTNAQSEGGRIKLPQLEKKLTKGERQDALGERQKNINDKFSDLSDEDKSGVLKDFKQAKQDTQTFRRSVKDPLTQQENEMGMKENIINDYTERAEQLKASTEASTEETPPQTTTTEQPKPSTEGDGDTPKPPTDKPPTDEPPTDEPTEPTKALTDGEKGMKDLDKVSGEVEELGGGPEDPITDIISLILGGIGLFGGIKASEKAKEDAPPPPQMSNISYQQGVN